MNTRTTSDWQIYHKLKSTYKSKLKLRSAEGWKRYCTGIESNNQAARVKGILAGEPERTLGCLKRPDETYTKTDAETSELLLETHFPGCQIKDDSDWPKHDGHPPSSEDWNIAQSFIDREKVLWAINTFLPFKSAGLDGIFPGLLKWSGEQIANHLVNVFRACIAHRYIPNKWREVKVVFIPKPGRSDYTLAKSFRPISLTSFLLKTLERLCDREIRGNVLHFKPLHPQQHAYSQGKSTESALHSVISRIGDGLSSKQPTLGAFIDIEGAFDKTTFSSINRALVGYGVPPTLSEWINNMLRYRAIQFTVNTTTRGIVARGCPQGGVLSPLLWNIVVDELIRNLNGHGLFTVGYADDLAILATGCFENTLCDLMKTAFKIIETWCVTHGLSVNPTKTELIMFTNKRNVANIRLPKLFNTELSLTSEVKYLGVTLDSKLLWNKHLDRKLQKACNTFYQCKRMVGKTWGLSPKITKWLYIAVIRPMLTYGAIVWWTRTELATVITKLQRFQRLACLAIAGCMKTTPTAALEVILEITPLDLYIQQEAAMAAIRLKHLGLWGNTRSQHANILDRALAYEPLIAAPCDKIPKQHVFQKQYRIQSCENESDQSGINEVRIYTDGSKTKQGTGAGIHSLDLNINITMTLGSHSSIFQCECVAITEAANAIIRRGIHGYNIRILSDSMAIIQALESYSCNSKLVNECRLALERVTLDNTLTLQWIKGHSKSLGNDAADELARRGSETTREGPPPFLPLPFAQFRLWMRKRTFFQHNDRWTKTTECRQSRTALPCVTPRLTRRLLNLKRPELRIIVGTITGHCLLNKHLHNLGNTDSPLCRGCLTEEETAAHVVLECTGVADQRREILKNPRSLREACEEPRKLLRFWAELGWLQF